MKAMSRALLVAFVLIVGGCATRTPAPVVERKPLEVPSPRVAATPAAPPSAAAAPGSATTYTVQRGDTLYMIALDQGLDYRDLAAWNGIDDVNLINVGQVLRLVPPDGAASPVADAPASTPMSASEGVVTAPLNTVDPVIEGQPAAVPGASVDTRAAGTQAVRDDAVKNAPKAVKAPYSDAMVRDYPKLLAAANGGAQPDTAATGGVVAGTASVSTPASTSAPAAASTPASASAAVSTPAPTASVARADTAQPATPSAAGNGDDRLDWVWPAKGKVVTAFSNTATLKGIDIAGALGDPVLASAPGKVVYAGSGLRGYGQLVIIKHNDIYLSAYAHNSKIIVKEGDQVTRGAKIAEMGNSDARTVKLHFEIRERGKPMDPQKFLSAQP
jgi:lipoprotein NlpD